MINLAGELPHVADDQCARELRAANLRPDFGERSKGEVQTAITAEFMGFTFERAWYYWRVHGRMPLYLAEKMYADPVGKSDVRVAGHCGCPPPDEWVEWWSSPIGGKRIISMKEREWVDKHLESESEPMRQVAERMDKEYLFSDSPESILGMFPYVTSYHVDSQEGLNLIVRTIYEYNA